MTLGARSRTASNPRRQFGLRTSLSKIMGVCLASSCLREKRPSPIAEVIAQKMDRLTQQPWRGQPFDT